jgi:hypothetical protein
VMALSSIEDGAPAVTEHAHYYYVDHSLPTPDLYDGRFRFVEPLSAAPSTPRGDKRGQAANALSEDEEEVFEEIGPGDLQGQNEVSLQGPPQGSPQGSPQGPPEDGNIDSPFQNTGTVYV